MNTGQQMVLLPSGAWPLTYHATTMNINGGASYTAAAGDRITAVKDLAGVIRVTVDKQDGTSVVSAGGGTNGWELLSTVTASSSSTVDIETTFNSTYDAYVLVISGLIGSYNQRNLFARMKIGGSYITTSTYRWYLQDQTSGVAGLADSASALVTNYIYVAKNIGNSAGDHGGNFELI